MNYSAKKASYDAVIIGAGPNGLSAAIALAKAGMSILLLECADTVGGGCRSGELTLPNYVHDICSSVYPLGFGSPFLRTLPLTNYGLEWVFPHASYAHTFDNGRVVLVEKSIEKTASQFGSDSEQYYNLMHSLSGNWDEICNVLLNPLKIAQYPWALMRFSVKAMMSANLFAHTYFKEEITQSVFAGVAAHSALPLTNLASNSIALVLALSAHTVGWPIVKGGSQNLSNALAAYLKDLGGEIILNCRIDSLESLPKSRFILCDLTPRQLANIAGSLLTAKYKKQLQNYQYGAGVFKVDWALSGPIEWNAAECSNSGTVHIGGTIEEIKLAEEVINKGQIFSKPYVLLVQPSLFDSTRAPSGKHTAWAYCHVPNGSSYDMTEIIEKQVERFASGFSKLIISRHTMSAQQLATYNANYIGGDIHGGSLRFSQLLARPLLRLIPYSTSNKKIFICSASTPPGSGVHGMCGYYAALAVLKSWSLGSRI